MSGFKQAIYQINKFKRGKKEVYNLGLEVNLLVGGVEDGIAFCQLEGFFTIRNSNKSQPFDFINDIREVLQASSPDNDIGLHLAVVSVNRIDISPNFGFNVFENTKILVDETNHKDIFVAKLDGIFSVRTKLIHELTTNIQSLILKLSI